MAIVWKNGDNAYFEGKAHSPAFAGGVITDMFLTAHGLFPEAMFLIFEQTFYLRSCLSNTNLMYIYINIKYLYFIAKI